MRVAFSRRRFLRFSLAAAALALLGWAGLFVRRRSVPGPGLRCLSAPEYETVSALAASLIPRGGEFPMGGADVDLARALDTFLADEPAWTQSEIKKALFLLELGPLLFERRFATFSGLSDDERLAHYLTWAQGDSLVRRQVAFALRRFLNIVFYDQPPVWEHLHYNGPLFRREDPQ